MTLSGTMALLLVGAVAAIARGFEGRWVTPPAILAASLLVPPVVAGLALAPLTWLVLDSATILFGFGYALVRLGGGREASTPAPLDPADLRRYYLALSVCFGVAQAAFLLNLARVVGTFGPLAYLTTGSKDIEVTFGAHTLLNYAFFLNLYAAGLAAYLRNRGGRRGLLALVLSVAVVELLFTGIKSTFLFGLMITTLVAMLTREERISGLLLRSLALLGAVVLAFFLVNVGLGGGGGSAEDGVFTGGLLRVIQRYFTPNYLNLDLELAVRQTFTHGKYTFWFVTKLFDPSIRGYFDTGDFFLRNADDNMGTFLREYWVDFGAAGVILVPPILGALCGGLRRWWIRGDRAAAALCLGVASTACAFAFFGNQFVRLQFIWVAVVALGIDVWVDLLRARTGAVVAAR